MKMPTNSNKRLGDYFDIEKIIKPKKMDKVERDFLKKMRIDMDKYKKTDVKIRKFKYEIKR